MGLFVRGFSLSRLYVIRIPDSRYETICHESALPFSAILCVFGLQTIKSFGCEKVARLLIYANAVGFSEMNIPTVVEYGLPDL